MCVCCKYSVSNVQLSNVQNSVAKTILYTRVKAVAWNLFKVIQYLRIVRVRVLYSVQYTYSTVQYHHLKTIAACRLVSCRLVASRRVASRLVSVRQSLEGRRSAYMCRVSRSSARKALRHEQQSIIFYRRGTHSLIFDHMESSAY